MTMIADLWTGGLIGFREALEATLLVVILLLFLKNSKRDDLTSSIWKGVGYGIFASIITAILFEFVIGSFEQNEAWFEGILMVASSIIIAFVILHLVKHLSKEDIENYTQQALDSGNGGKAMFSIAFLSVWREGSETVVFLSASTDTMWAIVGLMIGIVISVSLGWAMLNKGMKVNIKKLFSISTMLLILVGAGLLAHGVHELQEEEAGIIPVIVDELWNVNPEWDGTGDAPALHDKGVIGGLFAAMLGWNGDPTLLEVLAWVAYFGVMYYLVKKDNKPTTKSSE